MRRLILIPVLATAACGSSSAIAADRGYSVTDFDRISVEGAYDVQVRVGPAAAAQAHGPQNGIDRLEVVVNDGTLIIRTSRTAWGGWPGEASEGKVAVAVTTPKLRALALAGSGSATVDHIRAPDVQLAVSGSGGIGVGAIEAETTSLAIAGSGGLKLAGTSKQARVSLQGSGDIDALGFSVQDATVTVAGSGDLRMAASRSAKVTSAGSGDITIDGTASCTVSRVGSGEVHCGKGG
jgi:hypothetical protein